MFWFWLLFICYLFYSISILFIPQADSGLIIYAGTTKTYYRDVRCQILRSVTMYHILPGQHHRMSSGICDRAVPGKDTLSISQMLTALGIVCCIFWSWRVKKRDYMKESSVSKWVKEMTAGKNPGEKIMDLKKWTLHNRYMPPNLVAL